MIVVHFLIRALLALLSLLPFRILRALGFSLGLLPYALRTRSARTTRVNIALCFPELEVGARRKLERESLQHSGATAFELAALWHWSEHRLRKLIKRVEGEELVLQLVEHHGVVGVLPHFGNWEFAAYECGRRFGFTAIYNPRRLGSIDDRVQRARGRFGGRMVPASSGGLRQLIKALRDKELILILPDQVPTRGSGVIVPFMNHDAQTTTLVQSLLARERTMPVIITVERVTGGFHVRFETVARDLGNEDSAVAASELNALIADKLRRAPAQYQWEYKRFRRLPDVDPYA